MDNFADLREVLSAIQEVGNAWQSENVSLRAQNSRLQNENEQLRREMQNLSEEVSKLEVKLAALRDELIKQLAADKADNQSFIKNYFGANVSSVESQTNEPTPSQDTDTTHNEQPNYPYPY